MKTILKIAFFSGIVLLSLLAVNSSDRESTRIAYRVTKVVDGDTIYITKDSNVLKIRLLGVDTPETVHPAKPVQFYGKEASRFSYNLMMGEQVYIEYDTIQPKLDHYGRTLAFVWRKEGDIELNAELIRQGYGKYEPNYPCKFSDKYIKLQNSAKKRNVGLWNESEQKKWLLK